ncbi:hypothetical protein ZTR_07953 [Talaromyces verruculosus]|nr:hypothetical protein ZTR_07953 [Talaromyces verruculosus]
MVYIMKIYVDGGCRRNGRSNAVAAAAACVKNKYGKYKIWKRNITYNPTNQRAEITAIIMALELALEKYEDDLDLLPQMDVEIFSDSKYAVNCMNTWIYKWCRNGWTNSAGNEVANRDLIEEASNLDDRVEEIGSVKYTWIPRSENEVADEACNQAMDAQERQNRRYHDSSSDDDYY